MTSSFVTRVTRSPLSRTTQTDAYAPKMSAAVKSDELVPRITKRQFVEGRADKMTMSRLIEPK
jgi:hypothetical protein